MITDSAAFLAVQLPDFLEMPCNFFMEKMQTGFERYRQQYHTQENTPDCSQMKSWEDCCQVLHQALRGLQDRTEYWLIFEYCLPREGGRRPDVLLLNDHQLIILEFKRKKLPALAADLDQAARYAYDLKEFHALSHDLAVHVALVLTKAERTNSIDETRNLRIVSGDGLGSYLQSRMDKGKEPKIQEWLTAPYDPSPSILEAAERVMEGEALPEIRKAKSTGLNDRLSILETMENFAREKKHHVLCFVTGVPGAGKTYLGLQFTYRIARKRGAVQALYLSGNGPLIHILKDILGEASQALVAPINKFLQGDPRRRSPYPVIVFDEGQRAWNAKNRGKSEPQELLEYMNSLPWGVLVVLVGTNQEINTGETVTPDDWSVALLQSAKHNWIVRGPESFIRGRFQGPNNVKWEPKYNLTTSLRSPLDEQIPAFVNSLIDGDVGMAKLLAGEIRHSYPLYITRDANAAARYCWERYDQQPTKHYGWMRSSQYNRQNNGRKSPSEYIPWFTALTSSPESCCAMTREKAVTEFECQGLEVDFAAVEWGTDFLWQNDQWQVYALRAGDENRRYRINTYRVLLTRGREGMILYFPKKLEFDETYALMKQVGFEEV